MKKLQRMAVASACALPLWASAQPPATHPAASAAAPLSFHSAFADYKPHRDIAVADWQEINASVDEAARGASATVRGDGPAAVPPPPSLGASSSARHGMPMRRHSVQPAKGQP